MPISTGFAVALKYCRAVVLFEEVFCIVEVRLEAKRLFDVGDTFGMVSIVESSSRLGIVVTGP